MLVDPQQAAGNVRIKVASGSAFIVRGGAHLPAQAGQMVFEADSLRTGADGRLGITLKDDTRVSLGPGSEVRLDRFVYAPAEGRMGLVLKVVRGVMAYVSGRIAKLSPDSIRLETRRQSWVSAERRWRFASCRNEPPRDPSPS